MSQRARRTTAVLDSFALVAYLEREPAGADVWQLLLAAERSAGPLLMSFINWGELYYCMARSNTGVSRCDRGPGLPTARKRG